MPFCSVCLSLNYAEVGKLEQFNPLLISIIESRLMCTRDPPDCKRQHQFVDHILSKAELMEFSSQTTENTSIEIVQESYSISTIRS